MQVCDFKIWNSFLGDSYDIYLKDKIVYGCFDDSLLELEVFVSDDEFSAVEKGIELLSKDIKKVPFSIEERELADAAWRYLQAYNHELFHFYQVLSLPSFRIRHILKRKMLEYEAATMLKFFEEGGSYSVGEDDSIMAIVNKGKLDAKQAGFKELIELEKTVSFYSECWIAEYKGISLQMLIESMAHIMSVQLNHESNNYLASIDKNPTYNLPYKFFLKKIDERNLEIRWKHLLFLYICYFSCQAICSPEDDDKILPVKVFFNMIARTEDYLHALTKLAERYERYSKAELIELVRFGLSKEDLETATLEQIASAYGFFELIPCIYQDFEKIHGGSSDLSESFSDHISNIFERKGFDLKDHNLLAQLAIFPAKFGQFSEIYQSIGGEFMPDNEFDIATEIGFYRFISNCRKLLDLRLPSIECCEVHGRVDGFEKIVNCQFEDGLAATLEKLIGKPASELFVKGECYVV